jgi:hypothetical protein
MAVIRNLHLCSTQKRIVGRAGRDAARKHLAETAKIAGIREHERQVTEQCLASAALFRQAGRDCAS